LCIFQIRNWREILVSCVILGFRREVDENCVLLGCYTASSGDSLPTFRDNLSVPHIYVVPKRH